jgi:hypothetical protein
MIDLAADETEVPTKLGERIPFLPWTFPFDWTQRQVWDFVLCLMVGAQELQDDPYNVDRWKAFGLYVALGLGWVALEYVCQPSPEYWLSVVGNFAALALLSLPAWWRRSLPWTRRDHLDWPLVAVPRWLSDRTFSNVRVRGDDVVELRSWNGRRPQYRALVALEPRANPDLLPELRRRAIIEQRLAILRTIRGDWSLHLQVRPVSARLVEVAAGPAWEWVRDNRLAELMVRRPLLVLKATSIAELERSAEAVLARFQRANMRAWRLYDATIRDLLEELWADAGGAGVARGRLRLDPQRVMAGRRLYRSFLVKELPRVIHLGWLRPLTSQSLLADVAIHVKTRRPGPARRSLERRITRWRAVNTDRDYALAEQDAERTRRAMERNEDTEADVSMVVTAFDEQASGVEEALETTLCQYEPALFAQDLARGDSLPIGRRSLRRSMKVDLRSVATTDILATAGYWPDGATLIGTSLYAPEPIGLNLVDPNNLNWSLFIAMLMGAGKTTAALTLAWRMANPHPDHPLATRGVQIVSIDFKATRDYQPLFRHLAERGQQASYNAWTDGPLGPLEGHCGFNLADVPEAERGQRMLELAQRVREWAAAHALERTMLLLMDEVLFTAQLPEGAAFLAEFGSQGRSLNVACVFMSQHIGPVLRHEKAALAFQNASHMFLGRQNETGIMAMKQHIHLDRVAEIELLNAPDGAGLLRIERRDGPVVLAVQVEPTPWELFEFGTNPAERLARYQRDRLAEVKVHRNGHTNGVASMRDLQLLAEERA